VNDTKARIYRLKANSILMPGQFLMPSSRNTEVDGIMNVYNCNMAFVFDCGTAFGGQR
jgi:hypothetical protein